MVWDFFSAGPFFFLFGKGRSWVLGLEARAFLWRYGSSFIFCDSTMLWCMHRPLSIPPPSLERLAGTVMPPRYPWPFFFLLCFALTLLLRLPLTSLTDTNHSFHDTDTHHIPPPALGAAHLDKGTARYVPYTPSPQPNIHNLTHSHHFTSSRLVYIGSSCLLITRFSSTLYVAWPGLFRGG